MIFSSSVPAPGICSRVLGAAASTALAGEIGSYLPFVRTRADREARGDPRLSIEERYPDKAAYLAKVTAAANDLVAQRLLLARDVPAVISRASAHWDWATRDARNR